MQCVKPSWPRCWHDRQAPLRASGRGRDQLQPDYDLEAIGQLYRDRADCENGFDELKNQWGRGGYTTQDLERCNLSARAVARIYNWWSWYVRLPHPKTRLEAITSRPLLLSGVARLTQHAGQCRLLVTLTHAAGDQIKTVIGNVRTGLDTILAAAPQLPKSERWRALVRYIIDRIIGTKSKNRPSTCLSPPPLAHIPAGQLRRIGDTTGSQADPFAPLGLVHPDRGDFIAIVGRYSDRKETRWLKASMRGTGGIPVESINGPVALPGIDLADHRDFWQAGFPALMITDTAFYRNHEYHRSGDTADRLDYVRMSRVVSAVDAGIRALE